MLLIWIRTAFESFMRQEPIVASNEELGAPRSLPKGEYVF